MDTFNIYKEKDQELKQQVLERVKAIHYMRTVVRPLLVKIGFLAIAATALSFLVSVPHVISNMLESGDIASYGNYLAHAFMHTERVVRFTIVAAIILLVLVAHDLLKNFKRLNFSKAS